MTQIIPRLAVSGTAPIGGSARALCAQSDAWLKELERARWEAQPRYSAGDGLAGTEVGELEVRTASEQGAAEPHWRQEEEAHASSATNRSAEPTGLSDVDGPAGTRLLAASTRVQQQTCAPSMQVAHMDIGCSKQDALQPVLASSSKAATAEPWSQRNVHVQVQAEGNEWAVWIRDAGISQERVRETLDAIEQLAGNAGPPRAVRLIVNGQPWPAEHGFPTDLHATGERRGN